MPSHQYFLLFAMLALFPLTTLADRTVTVSPDGTADFLSISAAVDAIKDASADNIVTVQVRPGTYQETVTTKHWVNIEGENRDTCVVVFDSGSDDPAVIVKADVFKAHTNSVIKNLTIIGRRVKYCIHSDGIAKHPPVIPKYSYTLQVENCRILRPVDAFSPKAPSGRGPYLFAVGIGLRGNQHLILKNCEIEAERPIYLHNWGQNAPCSLTLEDCVLMTRGKTAITFQSLGGSGQDRLVLHRCRFRGTGDPLVYSIHPTLHPKAALGDPPFPQEIQVLGHGNVFQVPPSLKIQDDSSATSASH